MVNKKYKVDVEMYGIKLQGSELDMYIEKRGGHLGTLSIRRGGVRWIPKNSKKHYYYLDWYGLSEAIKEKGRKSYF